MLGNIFSWDTLWWLLIPIYVVACAGLIAVVLLQKGKGVGFAGAFGVGPGSETLFGPRSAKTLPQKLTYVGAALFMILALVMSMLAGKLGKGEAPELVDQTAVQESAGLDALFDGVTSEVGEEAVETSAAKMKVTPLVVDTATSEEATAEKPATEEASAESPAADAESPAETPPAAEAPAGDTTAEGPAEEAPAEESPAPETPSQ